MVRLRCFDLFSGITILSRIGFAPGMIMAVTGQKSTETIARYNRCSEGDKLLMGASIGDVLSGKKPAPSGSVYDCDFPVTYPKKAPSAALGAPPTRPILPKVSPVYTSTPKRSIAPPQPLKPIPLEKRVLPVPKPLMEAFQRREKLREEFEKERQKKESVALQRKKLFDDASLLQVVDDDGNDLLDDSEEQSFHTPPEAVVAESAAVDEEKENLDNSEDYLLHAMQQFEKSPEGVQYLRAMQQIQTKKSSVFQGCKIGNVHFHFHQK